MLYTRKHPMNLFDIVNGAEFNPKEIDYTQYDDLGVAIALSFYMCNAKHLTVINEALGEDVLKRLEVKDRGLVSEKAGDFDLLIGLVEDVMNHSRSKIGLTQDFINEMQTQS